MLTHVAIEAAKPKEKAYKISDGKGLYLAIEASGSKLWRFRYRYDDKEKMLSFGSWPTTSLAQARNKRDDARKILAHGKDPSQHRRDEKLAAAFASQNTFGVIAQGYIDKLVKEGAAEATISKNQWLLLGLAKPLHDRPITEIKPIELLDLLKKVEATGRRETARRLRGTIGSVFRYAIVTMRAQTDPTYSLRGALLRPIVTHRAAITDEKKLGALMSSIDEYDGWPTIRAALLLLALTMTRPGDIRFLKKPEIDKEAALWRIPAARMKMRRDHIVPLSRQALSVIDSVWDINADDGLLLPSIRSLKKPLSENAMNSALRRMGYSQTEMTAHGFRSSASTIINERHLAESDVIEAALAHQDEDEVRRAYNRAQYLTERTLLMQQWADLLDQFRSAK